MKVNCIAGYPPTLFKYGLTLNDYMVNEGKNLAYTTLMWRQARYVVGRRDGYQSNFAVLNLQNKARII